MISYNIACFFSVAIDVKKSLIELIYGKLIIFKFISIQKQHTFLTGVSGRAVPKCVTSQERRDTHGDDTLRTSTSEPQETRYRVEIFFKF